MDFWKRARRIGFVLIVAIWLIAVAAAWFDGAATTARPSVCITNCL